MKVMDKKNSSLVSGSTMGKNIITAGLAFSISTFTTLKPIDKEEFAPSKKSQNQFNELKIEIDAYDMIRKLL
jgi:hypothetical protein